MKVKHLTFYNNKLMVHMYH